MEEQQWTTIVRGESKNRFNLKELLNCKDLILLWVRRDFVSKYKQTVLGPAWAIIQPFFTTVVYSIFFGNIAGLGASGVPNFIFYLSGNIVWALFSGSLNSNANTFVSNAGIFSKVYFPRLVMPISSAISQFINFAIQFVFMLGFLFYYMFTGAGVEPNIYILMTPLVLIQLAALGMGCGVIISSMTTKYRDLQMVVGFGVSLCLLLPMICSAEAFWHPVDSFIIFICAILLLRQLIYLDMLFWGLEKLTGCFMESVGL